MGAFNLNPESANIEDVVNQAGTPQAPPAQPPQQAPQPDQIKQSLDIADQHYQQQYQANTPKPASGGPIRSLLQNFFSGMGSSMMHEAGLPTPQEKQQQALTGMQSVENARGMLALHQMEAQRQQMMTQQMMRQPTPPDLEQFGIPQGTMMTPAEQVQAITKYNQLKQQGQNAVAHQQTTNEGKLDVQDLKNQSPGASKTNKVDPVIAAQIGLPPDPAKFPAGQDDPQFKALSKLWGVQAETIKNRMAAASGAARGAAFNLSKPGGYITPEGDLVTATAGTAINQGYIPAAPGFQSMSKQSQFGEMQSASGKLRTSITALQPSDAFSASTIAQMQLAMRSPDEGVMHSIINNLMASGLNERQQDYVIWLGQMNERILSLRNVAGMGQGASDLRAAVQATLPNVASGNKQLALKKLDAVDNQINQLYKGIPKNRVTNPPANSATTPASGFAAWKASH